MALTFKWVVFRLFVYNIKAHPIPHKKAGETSPASGLNGRCFSCDGVAGWCVSETPGTEQTGWLRREFQKRSKRYPFAFSSDLAVVIDDLRWSELLGSGVFRFIANSVPGSGFSRISPFRRAQGGGASGWGWQVPWEGVLFLSGLTYREGPVPGVNGFGRATSGR